MISFRDQIRLDNLERDRQILSDKLHVLAESVNRLWEVARAAEAAPRFPNATGGNFVPADVPGTSAGRPTLHLNKGKNA